VKSYVAPKFMIERVFNVRYWYNINAYDDIRQLTNSFFIFWRSQTSLPKMVLGIIELETFRWTHRKVPNQHANPSGLTNSFFQIITNVHVSASMPHRWPVKPRHNSFQVICDWYVLMPNNPKFPTKLREIESERGKWNRKYSGIKLTVLLPINSCFPYFLIPITNRHIWHRQWQLLSIILLMPLPFMYKHMLLFHNICSVSNLHEN